MCTQRLIRALIGCLLFFLFFTSDVSANEVWRNPGPFPEGMDTWYGSVYSTSAQHDYRLRVGGWGDEYDTLIRFDLSGLPQNADQAVLWLRTISEGIPTDVNWYFLTDQWHSGTVGWSTQPTGTYFGRTTAPVPGNWYGIVITNQYNQWRSGNTATANYGLKLRPASTNNNYSSFYSSTQGGGLGPWLQVVYAPQANDNILKLKWPLATTYASRMVTQPFGVDWTGGSVCSTTGVIKKHNGTDFQAAVGAAVYAAEDGVIKHVENHTGWAYHIVIEHTNPTGGKYTTVYWHVNPVADTSSAGGFVPKGVQIATVADLGTSTHLHFGVRIGAYNDPVSGTGALPQTNCDGYPAFPEYFIDPNNTNNVLFQ